MAIIVFLSRFNSINFQSFLAQVKLWKLCIVLMCLVLFQVSKYATNLGRYDKGFIFTMFQPFCILWGLKMMHIWLGNQKYSSMSCNSSLFQIWFSHLHYLLLVLSIDQYKSYIVSLRLMFFYYRNINRKNWGVRVLIKP